MKFKNISLLVLLAVSFIIPLKAQTDIFEQDTTDSICSHGSFDLAVNGVGISFGNSQNFTGLRFNTVDCGIGKINGINVTLWAPGHNPNSEINGFALGIAPNASVIKGVSFGVAGVITDKSLLGISLGGLAVVSQGDIKGVNISGLAVVAQKQLYGINIGGLATVSQGDMKGINIGGLATVSQGSLKGLNLGGLAVVSQGELYGLNLGGLALVSQGSMKGINVGGLALVSQKDLTGLNFGGLALVTQQNLKGLNIGGLAIVGTGNEITGINMTVGKMLNKNSIKGLNFAGYKIETKNLTGLNASIIWTEAENMKGFSFAAYNRFYGKQTGIAIGLFNFAEVLKGIQIGIFNIAKNNPIPFRILPLINIHK